MIFFFGNSSAKSTFKILAQNNSPAEICPDNSSLSPNHTYIGSKDAGHCPATFKPIFKAIGLKLELSGQISAGGCCVPKSGKKSPSKSESAPCEASCAHVMYVCHVRYVSTYIGEKHTTYTVIHTLLYTY